MKYKYQKVVVGGTFDLLHAGHKKLLSKAFEISEFVGIGITTDTFVKEKKKEQYQDQEKRRENLEDYLKKQNHSGRYEIIFIDDIFGTTLNDKALQAIVVTDETQKNAKLINNKRSDKHLSPLKIIIVPYELDQKRDIISSSRIKSGKISSDGKVYKELLLSIADKQFDENIRKQLRIPIGELISDVNQKSDIITVGDITTQKIIQLGIVPYLSIVDFKVQRKKMFKSLGQIGLKKEKADKTIINPAGEITKELIEAIDQALQKSEKNQVIFVDGEEDLAVIPVVLLSKLGNQVLYGQPNAGMVEILVNNVIKNQLCGILGM